METGMIYLTEKYPTTSKIIFVCGLVGLVGALLHPGIGLAVGGLVSVGFIVDSSK